MVVVIGTGTPTVASSVELTFTNGAKTAAVSGTPLTVTAATAMTAFTSITLASQQSGDTVNPVLVFTPFTSIPSGGTITLTMPAGYFLGSVTSIASSVTSLTATSAPAATSTSTTIVLMTGGGVATGIASITMTLTGLTLGAARGAAAGGFTLSSSQDVTSTAGVNALAITGLFSFTSITSGGVAGAARNPVIVFQPKTSVPIDGKITLTMPAGYFLGMVTSIASSVTSLTATSTPAATATSTSIVLTTAGAETGTAAITITLIGLTLGAPRAIVTAGFQLSTSADTTLTTGLDSAAITGITFTSITSGGVVGAAMNPVLVFTPLTSVPIDGKITLTMPAGYFLGRVASIASSVTSLTATSTFAAMAQNTSIVLITAGAPTGTAAITMTLTGLTLGIARPIVVGGFALSTSVDLGLSVALNSNAITAPATAAASSAPALVVSVFCQFVAAFIMIVALH